MDMQTSADIDRLLKHTPIFPGKWVTLNSVVVDAATGEKGRLRLRPHSVTEIGAIFSRFPMLKKLFNFGTRVGDHIDWVDALAMAGKPALVALIAQNVGRYQDAKFEAFISSLPDDDFIEILATWREITMPEGTKDFLLRLVRYLKRLGLHPLLADKMMAMLETIAAKMSEWLSNQAGLLEFSNSTSESQNSETGDATPMTPSSSSAPSVPNSNSEAAEPIPG